MVKRHLITTALEDTWPNDPSEPVIFLGEWCKLFSRQHIWSKMDYEVLPYHWDDHKKILSDALYLNNLYEEILSELSNRLNQFVSPSNTVGCSHVALTVKNLSKLYTEIMQVFLKGIQKSKMA